MGWLSDIKKAFKEGMEETQSKAKQSNDDASQTEKQGKEPEKEEKEEKED